MKYPSILNRIIVGLITTITLITILHLVVIGDLKKLGQINQQTIIHPFTVSNALKDISIRINAIHRSMKDVAVAENEEELNSAFSMVAGYDSEIMELFTLVGERYLGNKSEVADAIQLFEDWRPIREETASFVKQGKTDEAYNNTTGKGAVLVDSLHHQLSHLITFALNKAQEMNAESESVSKETVKESIFLVSLVSILILLVLTWIFISVRNPLRKITKRINTLSEKNTQTLPLPESKNILTILNSSVDNMENLINNLEKIVKQRTLELREEKEFTEKALNAQSDTFFVHDPETGQAIRWNKAFTRFSGYTDEEIKNLKAPESYFNPGDFKKAQEALQGIMEKGFGTIRLNLLTKKGDYIPFEYLVSKIEDKNSGKTYLVSIGRDITQRLVNEAELEQHRNNLQKLVNEQTEEIQATNEELKTANEELAAMNEEAAASNEELYAANEELAVTNEELASANEDLERTSNKLSAMNKKLLEANEELERFNSLFVDREFRIKELKEKVIELQNKLNNK